MLLPLLLALAAPPDSLVHRGDLGDTQIMPPRVAEAEVRVDGDLSEAVWQEATVLSGFTRYEPSEGVPASQRTQVRVFYTPEAIYFGIEAFDDQPDQIRATLADRDRSAWTDDWVRIILDTFNDNRQAYIFYVNPLGIQQDGLWVEGMEKRAGGQPIDFNPDFIWDSRGRITPEGWVAEIRIPYGSLRFREAEAQTWGVNFGREIKRTGVKEAWAPITQNQASTLAQNGRLVGLRGIHPRRLVEINPVATARLTGERVDAGPFVRDDFRPEFGANARYGITPNLVMDATVNPDFSQLEADEGQIAVNERFALFFPEKRPFFLEGTEIFRTPQRLVHTRSVVDPIGGAKLTGKLGSFNVGYLGAVDESPLSAEPADRAAFNLVRLRRDVGAGSTVGALFTDKSLTQSGGYNRVAGMDARLLFAGRYALTAQYARSWTREAGGDEALPSAPLLYLQLERSGRKLGWEVSLNDVAPEFRARSGFIQRTGDAQLFAKASYTFYGKPGALIERFSPEIRFDNYFDHDALWRGQRPEEGEVETQWSFTLRGKNRISTILRYGYFDFLPEDYASYRVESAPGVVAPFQTPDPLRGLLGAAVMPHFEPLPWMTLSGRMFYRELPIYFEANRGLEFQVAPELRLRPTPQLSVEVSQTHSKLWRVRDESLFSTANISRFRVRYRFDRALSARAMVQYNLLDRDALRDPRTGELLWVGSGPSARVNRGDFGIDLLAAYEPSPGRVIYVGYSQQRRGPETYLYDRMEPQFDGLFLKFSYLFRM